MLMNEKHYSISHAVDLNLKDHVLNCESWSSFGFLLWTTKKIGSITSLKFEKEDERVKLESLQVGDIVVYRWVDAFEFTGEIPLRKGKLQEAVWLETGIFLFLSKNNKQHFVCGYAKPPGDFLEWKFTAVPTDLLVDVYLVNRGLVKKLLGRAILERVKKAALSTLPDLKDRKVKRWQCRIG